jgi:hypothetical protein
MTTNLPEIWLYLADANTSPDERVAAERLYSRASRLVVVPMGDLRRGASPPGDALAYAVPGSESAIPTSADNLARAYLPLQE